MVRNSRIAGSAIVVALASVLSSQSIAQPEPEIRPDPIVYQRLTYWQTFQQLPPALRYSAYVGGAIGAAGAIYMGGTLAAPYLGLGAASTPAWMTNPPAAGLVIGKALSNDMLALAGRSSLGGSVVGGSQAGAAFLAESGPIAGLGPWAIKGTSLNALAAGLVGSTILGARDADAAPMANANTPQNNPVGGATAANQGGQAQAVVNNSPLLSQRTQPAGQRQTDTTQPGSPVGADNNAQPIGGAGVQQQSANSPPPKAQWDSRFDIFGAGPNSMTSLSPTDGGGFAGRTIFNNDIFSRSQAGTGGLSAASQKLLNMAMADYNVLMRAANACLANPHNCSAPDVPYSINELNKQANAVKNTANAGNGAGANATAAGGNSGNKIMTPVLQPDGSFKYVDSGSSGRPVTESAGAKVTGKSAPSGISGLSKTSSQATGAASGSQPLTGASALRPGGPTAVQQFAALAPAGHSSNSGNPATGLIAVKPLVNSSPGQPAIGYEVGRDPLPKNPAIGTRQPPSGILPRNPGRPSIGTETGKKPPAASTTPSSTITAHTGSAANRATSNAAANSASRAASNAAGRAASNAASRAASSAASRAASNAASNAAANAASRVRIPSDIRLKQDIVALGRTRNGLRLYRYRYLGDNTLYVGVMAQEVARRAPGAVMRGEGGYLEVDYRQLGIDFLTFDQWLARGALPFAN